MPSCHFGGNSGSSTFSPVVSKSLNHPPCASLMAKSFSSATIEADARAQARDDHILESNKPGKKKKDTTDGDDGIDKNHGKPSEKF